jgi:hypothetical protein
MKRKNNILIGIFLLLLGACTEAIDVNLPAEEDRVVIEGLVTTQTKPFVVKLSKTIALGDSANYAYINNATVIISDNLGNKDTLALVTSGRYETTVPKTGVVGRTYYLTVKTGGVTYSAQDKLRSVAPIDSLYAIYLTAGSAFGVTKDGYYVFYNSSDPPNQKNYYRYKMFRNGKSVLNPSSIAVFDDRFLSPVIIGARLPGKYNSTDKAKVELYSLSESAYNFYVGLATQLQNDGGFFSTPPANAPTNLSNGALGFFQASDIEVDSLIVP